MVECLPRDYSSRGRTLARSHQKCSHKVAHLMLDMSAPFSPVLQGAAATLEVLSMSSNWFFFCFVFLCKQDKSN